MKTNFKPNSSTNPEKTDENKVPNVTKEQFEEFIVKSGAKGSFMVYRSNKKDEELGLDEL